MVEIPMNLESYNPQTSLPINNYRYMYIIMVVTFICLFNHFVSTVKLPTVLAGLRPMGGRNIQPSLQSPLAASFSSPGGSVVNCGTTAITNRCSPQN